MLIHHTSQHPSPTSQCKLHSRAPAASLQPAACKPGIVGNFKGVPSIPAAMAVCFSAVSSSKPRHIQLQGRPVPPGGPTVMPGRLLRDEGRKGNGAENAAQTVPHSSPPVPQTLLTGWEPQRVEDGSAPSRRRRGEPCAGPWAGVRCTGSHPESLGVEGLLQGVEDRGVAGNVGILEPRIYGSKTRRPQGGFQDVV